MTDLYFIRHAQPAANWADDRSRPLSELGTQDSKALAVFMKSYPITACYSSTYQRAIETITPTAEAFGLNVVTDERLREWVLPYMVTDSLVIDYWNNCDYKKPGSESINELADRNAKAVLNVLGNHEGESVIIGTHGAALASIIKFFNPYASQDVFQRHYNYLPYVLRMTFKKTVLEEWHEELIIKRGYIGVSQNTY